MISMAPPRRRLITFEGMEGCGKSTQIARLEQWMRQRDLPVSAFREPGGTALGEAVRRLLKHDAAGQGMCAESELLLFAASRAELTRKAILPALADGSWVLCDRFLDSTTIYQGMARGLDPATVAAINHFAVGPAYPGLTLLLDLPLTTALDRMNARRQPGDPADRMEEQSLSFYEDVARAYRELAQTDPNRVILIDADRDPDAVFATILEHLNHAFRRELDHQ